MLPWWSALILGLLSYEAGWLWARRFYRRGDDGLTRPERQQHERRWCKGLGATTSEDEAIELRRLWETR